MFSLNCHLSWRFLPHLLLLAIVNFIFNTNLSFGQSLTSDASVIDAYVGGRCNAEQQAFELRSGFIQVSPSDTLATIPHSLHLTDCLARCARHAHCAALNFETGLCVLFNRSAPGLLSAANFPVFTLHARKRCLPGSLSAASLRRPSQCASGWALDTLNGRRLRAPVARLAAPQRTELHCLARCAEETAFACRAVNFRPSDGRCELLKTDRHALGDQGTDALLTDERWIHIQNGCVAKPSGVCRFRRLRGRMLKTADSLYEHVIDEPSCKALCLQSPTPCRTYTLGDPNNKACRISHLSTYSASHIIDPWMITPGADTYELTACYNVTVSCDSREMIAHVSTDRQFSGKLYAKGKPRSCVNDVQRSLEFELRLPYEDENCDVQQAENGTKFSKDIIIQHHDLILTTKDIGLSLHCSYDLSNRTVQNTIHFEPDSEGKEELDERVVHSSFVYSPNVTIQIKDVNGLDVHTARVGDPLTLRFVIDDENTPYEIFIHDLVASDGTPSNEITLIDSNGCPTDPAILGPIKRRQMRSEEDDEAKQFTSNPTLAEDIANDMETSTSPRSARLQAITGSTITTIRSTDSTGTTNYDTIQISNGTTPQSISSTGTTESRSTSTFIPLTSTMGGSASTLTTTLASTSGSPTITTLARPAPKSGARSTTLSPNPTTTTIEISIASFRSKQLEASFEAFKFPTTNLVQFRAIVTPCLGECAPAHCMIQGADGARRSIISHGRRRRRSVHRKPISSTEEPLVVVQTIQISDNFESKAAKNRDSYKRTPLPIGFRRAGETGSFDLLSCLGAGGMGLVMGIIIFGQLALLIVWLHFRGQWRSSQSRSWTPRTSKHVINTMPVHPQPVCR